MFDDFIVIFIRVEFYRCSYMFDCTYLMENCVVWDFFGDSFRRL